MRISRLIIGVIGLLGCGLLGGAGAVAAPPAGPYCVVITGMPANCRFFDEASCARAATMQGGGCVSRFATPLANAPKDAGYCLVSHGDAKCLYYDAASCAQAARLEGGSCLTRPRLATASR